MVDPFTLRDQYAERLARSTRLPGVQCDRIILDLFQRTPRESCETSYKAFLAFFRETDDVQKALSLAELWYQAKFDNALQ